MDSKDGRLFLRTTALLARFIRTFLLFVRTIAATITALFIRCLWDVHWGLADYCAGTERCCEGDEDLFFHGQVHFRIQIGDEPKLVIVRR